MNITPACPGCGKPLGANALHGLCATCLMKGAFPTGSDIGGKTPFVPPTPEELAVRFPQLEILGFVGQGGMGAVYKVRQKQLDRVVALKILPPQAAAGSGFAERFTREARALAKLNHSHIVTLYEFGQTDGLFFFLMEFVDGVTLRQLLNTSRIASKEALAIVPQICEALQFAHDEGIVHRDIKPENILLDKKGRVKIADFGIAKIVAEGLRDAPTGGATSDQASELTEAGSVLGTPQYMAPEQVAHPLDVDHRADIYSLGVVFYQMLTGELPDKRIDAPSKKVQIDVRLDEVVLRALEKKPERRYQHASQVKEELETIVISAMSKASKVESPRAAAIGESAAADESPAGNGPKVRVVAIILALSILFVIVQALWSSHRNSTVDVSKKTGEDALQTGRSSGKTRTRQLAGAPFIATYPGGRIELVAVAPFPSTNQPSWQPDGSPAKEPFPADNGSFSAEGRELRQMVFHVRSRDQEPSPVELKPEKSQPIATMGYSESYHGGYAETVQKLTIEPGTKSARFQVGVADGKWETVSTLTPYTNAILENGIQKSASQMIGDWDAGVDCIVTKDGGFTVSYRYSTREDWETRMMVVYQNGKREELRSPTSTEAWLVHGVASFNAAEGEKINAFEFQRRPYSWVEFRNVSLQPGFRTTVEIVDSGEETNPTPENAVAFGPLVDRVLELHGPPGGYNLETGDFIRYISPPDAILTPATDPEWLKHFGIGLFLRNGTNAPDRKADEAAKPPPIILRTYPALSSEVTDEFLAQYGQAYHAFITLIDQKYHTTKIDAVTVATTNFDLLVSNFNRTNKTFPITASMAKAWAQDDSETASNIQVAWLARLGEALRRPITPDDSPNDIAANDSVIIVSLKNQYEALSLSDARSRGKLGGTSSFRKLGAARSVLRRAFPDDEQAAARAVAGLIKPNCFVDEQLTRLNRTQANLIPAGAMPAVELVGKPAIAVDSSYWDLSATDLLARVPETWRSKNEANGSVKLNQYGTYDITTLAIPRFEPASYLIRGYFGKRQIGLLQIVGFTDDGRGVKIRYKPVTTD